MTTLNITEATTVQFPMVRHAAEIGWTPIPPLAPCKSAAARPGCYSAMSLKEHSGDSIPR